MNDKEYIPKRLKKGEESIIPASEAKKSIAAAKKIKESKKAKVVEFIKKAIAKRRAKKVVSNEDKYASQEGKLKSLKAKLRLTQDDRTELYELHQLRDSLVKEEAKEKYAGKVLTVESVLPEVIKQLKVGDTVHLGQYSGYMGDGGDGRDQGYMFETKVTQKRGYVFKVNYTEYGKEKQETCSLNTSHTPFWLSTSNYTVFYINNKSEDSVYRGFSGQVLRKGQEYFQEQGLVKKAEKKKEKLQEDWTKGSKDDLIRIIDEHFAKEGKRLTGHKTASKPRLIEIIRKYKIRE